ncbi:16S rRNA (cytosine(1402)-N(4))-methyltransferase RsmH [Candidatus Babeliales bacterium]|nr:16S rRNA (cytosine(1402)-N(4))-methyltransferase RsmH [Candidatus Babeliales bacterium]
MHETQGHISVLLDETINYLDPQPGKVYVDATLGGAGHSKAILQREPKAIIIGLDWDKSVIDTTGKQLMQEYPGQFFAVYGNFAKLPELIERAGFTKVDGILADFGTSQMQIRSTPGFSVYVDTYLDMRFSPSMYYHTAYDVVNRYKEDDLAQIFFDLGGESRGRKIARAIIQQRQNKKIETTFELAELIKKMTPGSYHKIHPATKVFQALRIHVNQELENIENFLKASLKTLKPDGRLVCISFHSLEDRLVKQFFKRHSAPTAPKQPHFKMLTKGACMASEQELKENRSARSARLRAGILTI